MSAALPVRYSMAAPGDLRKIGVDLAKARGSVFADPYLDRLVDRIATLALHPRRYRERARFGVERRIMPLLPYHVIYIVEVDRIRILRIVHGRRRITKRDIGS